MFRALPLVLAVLGQSLDAIANDDGTAVKESAFLQNGVTAHRGNSSKFPENTISAFRSGIEAGADWIELDVFRTKDGKLVVVHDETTERVGDKKLNVSEVSYQELLTVDVATEFRRRNMQTLEDCPPQQIPLLRDVLLLVMKQNRCRVSIQPKMNCVAEAVTLVRSMNAARWVGFNDGNVDFMAEVKQLAPDIPVFWDRDKDADVDHDILIAKKHGFEALVIHHEGVTQDKVRKVKAAGLEVGAWTVNDRDTMQRLLNLGVQRLYTDMPGLLLSLTAHRFKSVQCEGRYRHHLQGICTNEKDTIYWSFTTTLVKTDSSGKVLKKVEVGNHHGDLCYHDGKIYVAVNFGRFNEPQGNADSWVYVYEADDLSLVSKHETQQVFYGAGGIGFREGHFFVVGGLPDGMGENYVYEYDNDFTFRKKHVVKSGHTLLGIQTAAFAQGKWWFGCYGDPKILLVTDANFNMLGRYEFDCSLGIAGLPGDELLSASGRCDKDSGCIGSARIALPDIQAGIKVRGGSERTSR